MVFAIVIPELVTSSAFAQRVAARTSVHEMAHVYHLRPTSDSREKARLIRWSMRHASYWNMEGVWINKTCKRVSDGRKQVSNIQIPPGAAEGFTYLVARLCIIANVLASLRALPEGESETIE